MNILITNDDGINSIGLQTLVKHMSLIGDVYVCAPESERSAFSHHFTFRGKMKFEYREVPFAKKAIALWGTPCDCIHCGLQFLYKDIKFDLVCSGINKGWNVLSDAIYSGTVAGAREGFMRGIPSMAVSLDTYDPFDFNYAASIASKLAIKHLNNKDNDKYFININVPALSSEEIKGIKVCNTIGDVTYDEGYYLEDNGIETFVVIGDTTKQVSTPDGSDTKALKDGYVSISPIFIDPVNHNVNNLEDIYTKDC